MRSFLGSLVAAVLIILLLLYSHNAHERIGKLRREVRELKGASVSLSPGSDGYQPIRHQLGSATLSLKEVRAHDKGCAITLEIGNLTSVHITGVTMEIEYRNPSKPGIEHSSKFEVKQTLEAGKGTKVTLILEGVNPLAVTYIRVSDFQPKGIRLIQAN